MSEFVCLYVCVCVPEFWEWRPQVMLLWTKCVRVCEKKGRVNNSGTTCVKCVRMLVYVSCVCALCVYPRIIKMRRFQHVRIAIVLLSVCVCVYVFVTLCFWCVSDMCRDSFDGFGRSYVIMNRWFRFLLSYIYV